MKESNAIHFEKDAFNLASTVATLLNKVLVTLIRQVVFFLMTDCPAMIVGESFILRSGCKPYSDVPLRRHRCRRYQSPIVCWRFAASFGSHWAFDHLPLFALWRA